MHELLFIVILGNAFHELAVGQQSGHRLRRQTDLQVDAPTALPPWEGQHYPIDPRTAKHRHGPPPPHVALIHGKPRRRAND